MLIDRRTFLGLLSGASLGASLSLGQPLNALAGARDAGKRTGRGKLHITPSVCDHDCGGRCLMQVHVVDGEITHISSDPRPVWPGAGATAPVMPLRTCTRGRAYREQVYSAQRILQPMQRVGRRGAGKFQPISWDEALGRVAENIERITAKHGPAAVFSGVGAGTQSALNSAFDLQMLLARRGGFTGGWTSPSWEGAHFAMQYTLGLNDEAPATEYADGADVEDFLNSKLLLLWGWNPAHTHFGTETKYILQRVREAGIPMICVDPVYTETAALWGSEWLPIRPGSDTAVLMAMAYVILDEGLEDKHFVERFVSGAEDYKQHLRGASDGVRKDPRWASGLSGIDAERIADLARQYASTRPANLVAGYAPGRSAFGEQYHRAAIALQALTGNVGRPGGGAAGHMVGKPLRYATTVQTWWGQFVRDVEVHDADIASIKTSRLASAILGGKHVDPASVGSYKALPSPIRMLYCVAWNLLNQLPNVNKTRQALEALDFIVVQEQRMTATARYADILLPACTMLERDDVTWPWRDRGDYLITQAKAIEPRGESRPDHWIFDRLAEKLKLEPLRGSGNPRQWLDELLALDGHAPFADLARHGVLRQRHKKTWVAFERNIREPEKYPFNTPSGRIEIASDTLASMDFAASSYGAVVPALPTHLENAEGPNNPQAEFPLQLITTKAQNRCHSTFTGNPLLEELSPQLVWIHPQDATRRKLKDGANVKVWNQRGRLRLLARVTERIRPGVVMIHEGASYEPDASGTDLAGNPNLLTSDLTSPGGAYAYNTARVELRAIKSGSSKV